MKDSKETFIDNTILEPALFNFMMDPKNPLYNFILAKSYEELGHTASAASYYLRAAEFEPDSLLAYESLLRLSLCLKKQGSRNFTVKGVLLRAISLKPLRPEAYFLLSRMYEFCQEWQESYTWAVLGEKLFKGYEEEETLRTNVEYPGVYGFTFQRAIAALFIGLFDESVDLLIQLNKNPNISPYHANAVKHNLKTIPYSWTDPVIYDDSYYEQLKIKFTGAEKIKQNHSQCYQDMFVLTMLDGKKNGLFFEIGAGDPIFGSNTYLLEKEFNWKGVSIDIDENIIQPWINNRSSKLIITDATQYEIYEKVLSDLGKDYDYLQIDCDPPLSSYLTLLRIPFDTHKFAVITFEHDHYIDENSQVREKSRKYLESKGYELVVNNIAPNKYYSFEDWWVHPDLVDRKIIDKMKCISDYPKKCDDYMFGKIKK